MSDDDKDDVDRGCAAPVCAFCGRSHYEVARMIERREKHICEDCLRRLAEALKR